MKTFSVFKNKESYGELRERTRRETSSQEIRDSQWHGNLALMERLANQAKWKQWDQKGWKYWDMTKWEKIVERFFMLPWRLARLFKWRIKIK